MPVVARRGHRRSPARGSHTEALRERGAWRELRWVTRRTIARRGPTVKESGVGDRGSGIGDRYSLTDVHEKGSSGSPRKERIERIFLTGTTPAAGSLPPAPSKRLIHLIRAVIRCIRMNPHALDAQRCALTGIHEKGSSGSPRKERIERMFLRGTTPAAGSLWAAPSKRLIHLIRAVIGWIRMNP